MPCDYCYPDVIDYGFQMNDVRKKLWLTDKFTGEPAGTATLTIVREWFRCEDCGHGSDYTCKYKISFPDGSAITNTIEAAYSIFYALVKNYDSEDAFEDYRAERYAHPPGTFD